MDNSAPSDNDNHLFQIPKRRRCTGTSSWTINALARQVAEKEADEEIDQMIRKNTAEREPTSDILLDDNLEDPPESYQTYINEAPVLRETISVSSVCGDYLQLIGIQEDEIDAAETSAETTNLTHSSLVPDLLTAERFLEENPEGILPYDESCVSASELSDEDFIDDDDYECLSGTAGHDFLRVQSTRLLTAAYFLKHHSSKSALEDFLAILINSSELYDDEELKSPYMFLKKYGLLKKGLKRTFPCTTCSKTLVNGEDGYPTVDQPCGHSYSKDSSDKCYSLLLPIDEQICYFIRHHGIKRNPSSATDNQAMKGDVCTGDRYKKYVDDGLIDECTITLQINTDGAQRFKSSKYSFWPFMGIINEASYKTRRSNIILMAIWYGNKKPPRNAFLDPCVAELKNLCSTGVECDGKFYKVRPIIVTVDTIARPTIRNTIQFNGEYGCDFCLHPGESISKGDGHSRVYREQWNENEPRYPPRNTVQYRNDLKEAIRSGKPYHGVKGPSSLADIPGFDFIAAFIPEYMHCVCLGVVRYFMLLWFSKSKTKQPWQIRGKMLDILNKRLANTKPPYDITRTSRSVDTIHFWKASEFRTFVLYYFPLLEGILPDPFFSHFSNLSYALSVLLQERVPTQNVIDVGYLLDNFVREVELLYGAEHVTYSVHLLTHLSKNVLDWGCLWATSAFIPEWFNGQLQSLSNGTQAVTEQMASNFLMQNSVRNQAISLLENPSLSPKVSELLRKMICLPNSFQFQNVKCEKVKGDVNASLLGKKVARNLSLAEQAAVENLLYKECIDGGTIEKIVSIIENEPCFLFPRLSLRTSSNIFTTAAYTRSKKRINFCALLEDGRFFLIENFVYIKEAEFNLQLYILGRSMGQESIEVYSPAPIEGKIFASFPGQTAKLIGLGELEAVLPKEITKKCVVAGYNPLLPSFIISALTNTVESD